MDYLTARMLPCIVDARTRRTETYQAAIIHHNKTLPGDRGSAEHKRIRCKSCDISCVRVWHVQCTIISWWPFFVSRLIGSFMLLLEENENVEKY